MMIKITIAAIITINTIIPIDEATKMISVCVEVLGVDVTVAPGMLIGIILYTIIIVCLHVIKSTIAYKQVDFS